MRENVGFHMKTEMLAVLLYVFAYTLTYSPEFSFNVQTILYSMLFYTIRKSEQSFSVLVASIMNTYV